jgi:hypothetical protein
MRTNVFDTGSKEPRPEGRGSLLPAHGQNRLHLLWPLIDFLIPSEASLLGKSRHRLDQLLDMHFRLPCLAVWLHHSYNVLSCEA